MYSQSASQRSQGTKRPKAVSQSVYRDRLKRSKQYTSTKKFSSPRRQLTAVAIGAGLPARLTTTLKYCDYGNFSSTAGALGSYNFKANGMVDPNETGGGHKPYYFTQIMAMYNHFHVLKAKIRLHLSPNSVSKPTQVCLWQNDDATVVPTDIDNICEQTRGVNKTFVPLTTTEMILELDWDASKTFGGSILGNSTLQGTVTTDPTELTCFTVSQRTLDVTTTSTLNYFVEIWYTATFSELKDIVKST